ncbi:MAG: hypothetical protein Hyperionvirus7_87, partial [Hyperionvirus sp.]
MPCCGKIVCLECVLPWVTEKKMCVRCPSNMD